MRGEYYTSGEDRRRFFHALNEMCKEEVFEIDLISSQLCLRDCLELLDELEYVYSDWDVDGGEGEIWVRPLSMWDEIVEVNGENMPRFKHIV